MKKTVLMIAIAISMAACSPFVLRSSGALNNSDLSAYKTYQIQKIDKAKLPEGMEETDAMRINRAIAAELDKRGYKYVESGGDLTVYTGVSLKRSLETTSTTMGYAAGAHPISHAHAAAVGNNGWGGYNYFGATPYVHGYYGTTNSDTELKTDGILMVDLVDNSNNEHVFYSQISANVENERMMLRDNEKLADAAATIFKKFPIKVPK